MPTHRVNVSGMPFARPKLKTEHRSHFYKSYEGQYPTPENLKSISYSDPCATKRLHLLLAPANGQSSTPAIPKNISQILLRVLSSSCSIPKDPRQTSPHCPSHVQHLRTNTCNPSEPPYTPSSNHLHTPSQSRSHRNKHLSLRPSSTGSSRSVAGRTVLLGRADAKVFPHLARYRTLNECKHQAIGQVACKCGVQKAHSIQKG